MRRWLPVLAIAVFVMAVPGAVGPAAQSPGTQAGSAEQQAIDQLLKDADAASRQRDFDTQLRLADDAIARSRALGDKDRLAQAIATRARVFYAKQQYRACADAMREAVAFFDEIPSLQAQFTVANNFGNCAWTSGAYDEGIMWQERAWRAARDLKNIGLEAQISSNLVGSLLGQGEMRLAQEWGRRAVDLSTQAHDDVRRAFSLSLLGYAYVLEPDTSIGYLRQGLDLFARVANTPQLKAQAATSYSTIAALEVLLGRNEAALRDADEYLARDAALGANNTPAIAVAERVKGQAYLQLGQLDAAEAAVLTSRAAWSRVVGDSDGFLDDLLWTELIYARVLRAKGRTDEAIAGFRSVLAAVERSRTGRHAATAIEPGTSSAYYAFADVLDSLVSGGAHADAFDVSERYRARLLLDMIDERRRGERGMTEAQQRREGELSAEAMKLQLRLLAPTLGAVERSALELDLRNVDLSIEALRGEIRRTSARSALRFSATQSSTDVQRALPRDTAVVSYVTSTSRSFILALTADRILTAPLPDDATLRRAVEPFVTRVSTRPTPGVRRTATLRRDAARLSAQLLGPVAELLAGKTRLVIIPDGPLNALPFEALTVPGRSASPAWLGERYVISYTPSMSALTALTAGADDARRSDAIFAVGDPLVGQPAASTRGPDVPFTALPATRVEVDRITRLFGGSRKVIGADATPATVRAADLEPFRYLHFAAHAFVNSVRPGRSGIVLAPEKGATGASILQADDIQALRLNADLVTLSACSTAVGPAISHEGLMSLARAFLIAGSKSVAASLWNVNDEATAALMVRFYSGLKAGKPRDEALSAARRALMLGADTRLNDPYYWAPFVLIGATR